MAAIEERSGLAFDARGSGQPVVFLHGLTFDRTTWRPIIDRLGQNVRSLAIDLPGHGESKGDPCSIWDAASRVYTLSTELGLARPIVVGHSISAAIASVYAASYPSLGVVNVDQSIDVRPFAQMVRSAWPVLSGPGFDSIFDHVIQSMGIDLIPEPYRSQVLASEHVDRDLVLGYWSELAVVDPEEMQARVDATARRIHCPYLAVFGHTLDPTERERLTGVVAHPEVEEWPDSGHFVHLVHMERFADRLADFIRTCRQRPERTGQGLSCCP